MPINKKIKHYLFLRKLHKDAVYGGCEKVLVDWLKEVDYEKVKVTLGGTRVKEIFRDRFEKSNLPVDIIEFDMVSRKNIFKKLLGMLVFLNKVKPTHIVYMQGTFSDFDLTEVLAGYIYSFGHVFMTEHAEAPVFVKAPVRYYFGLIPKLGLWWHKIKVLFMLRAYLSKRILAVSKTVKERMVKFYGYPEKKIYIVYHGVEIDKFSPDINVRINMRKTLNIPNDDIVIISTGRLSEEKRLPSIINAFDGVNEICKNIWLLIVGDGSQREGLGILANSKSSKERIIFSGFQEDVSGYLKMSDVYVLASGIEEFAIAMLEAMSTGLVAVVAKVPSPHTLIDNDVNGFLVEPSEQGIANGLRRALSLTEKERTQISRNARRLSEEHFDIKTNVKAALNILEL